MEDRALCNSQARSDVRLAASVYFDGFASISGSIINRQGVANFDIAACIGAAAHGWIGPSKGDVFAHRSTTLAHRISVGCYDQSLQRYGRGEKKKQQKTMSSFSCLVLVVACVAATTAMGEEGANFQVTCEGNFAIQPPEGT